MRGEDVKDLITSLDNELTEKELEIIERKKITEPVSILKMRLGVPKLQVIVFCFFLMQILFKFLKFKNFLHLKYFLKKCRENFKP